MIALDTNILARYLLNDSPAQADSAEKLLHGSEPCTAPITVFLELVWVLESCDCEPVEIVKSIRLLCGLENFRPQNLDVLAYALHWYEGGMDFGDALHLAMSAKENGFKTFDKAFLKKAKELGAYPIVTAP
ncbi:type II toxin-antitoxin system VapC family toxin [Collimonas silvisoli]|uniref:type II toxin-antitoxin system VapC family toxin n=1 Tax=Collimonas silvisoli TaxID=2825884 RepID=UPI001B8BFBCE